MIVLTAIQDNFYLSWQAELLALNCRDLGHELIIISGYRGQPSASARMLATEYGAFLFEDNRTDLSYSPSIQPHLLAQYADSPHYNGGQVLLVDSDILFKSLDFLLQLPAPAPQVPPPLYMSDCSGYLDSRYLVSTDPDIMHQLCTIAGLDPAYVRHHPASGGAQYVLPHLFNSDLWRQIETTSNAMHRFMRHYRCRHHPVQTWTASMWAILYSLYKKEQAGECTVQTSDLLKFCFATDPACFWETHNILHMAGVTADMADQGYFFKGDYSATAAPWECDLAHVQPGNCSFVYVEAMRRLMGERLR